MNTYRVINQKRLLIANRTSYIFYKSGKLYKADAPDQPGRLLCRLPASRLKKIFFRIPLLERIFRLSPRCAAWIDAHLFVFAQKGQAYCVDLESGELRNEFSFPPGMSSPIYLQRIQGITGFEDGVYCGAYLGNRDCRVCIWHRDWTGTWREVYQFPRGSVLHIHNIIPDKSNQRLLVLTGDQDQESAIWDMRNGFSSVTPLLQGSQQYRACVAFPCAGHILFATDTPLEQNCLYDYEEATGKITVVQKMPGPVIFGCAIETGEQTQYMMATSVEPDSRITGIRYLLTRALGAGVQDRYSHVFYGYGTEGLREICSFRKDLWPMALCQFGNVCFPDGDLDKIYVCPQSVKKFAGKTLEVSV